MSNPSLMIEEILDEFDQAWQTGAEVPDLQLFLDRISVEHRASLLKELVPIDLEYRWTRFCDKPPSEVISKLPARPRLTDYAHRFGKLFSPEQMTSELRAEEEKVRQRFVASQESNSGEALRDTTYVQGNNRPPSERSKTLGQFDLSAWTLDVVHQLGNAFYHALQSGESPRIEDVLEQVTSSLHSRLLTDLLQIELRHRREAGETPLRDEYTVRFPNSIGELNAVFGESDFERQETPLSQPNTTIMTPPDEWSGAPATSGPSLGRYGDYELLVELGRGGMGVVYKAQQISTHRIVALKLIRADRFGNPEEPYYREAAERFRLETKAAARLQHENLITVYDVGEINGQPYYSMQYVEGQSLHALVKSRPLERV
ncbi:MAG: hypothetical protein KDA84_20200 [Planctomycetaceae bacterium]|nr:hypothetical protein [Planctomycetaceae bacterium]